jgi:hypothetical protein
LIRPPLQPTTCSAPPTYLLRGPGAAPGAGGELRALPEAGLNSYNYFTLMKQKEGFLLMPISQYYTAKPQVK